MIKRTLYIVLALWLSFIGFPVFATAQSVDVGRDTLRIIDAIEASYALYDSFNMDSSLWVGEEALELSRKLFFSEAVKANSADYDIVKSLFAESYGNYAAVYREFDLEASQDTLFAALAYFDDSDLFEKGVIYSQIGQGFDLKGQYDSALKYSSLSLEAFKEQDGNDYYVNQLIYKGTALRNMGRYGESLELFLESLKIGRKLQNDDVVVSSLLAMGFVYIFVEQWDEAIKSQNEALRIYQEMEDEWGISTVYNDIGVLYEYSGKLDSSLYYHRAALDLRLKLKDSYFIFSSYLYIADILALEGETNESIEAYKQALYYGEQTDYKTSVVDAYLGLGKIYLNLSDLENASYYFEKALKLSDQIDFNTGSSSANLYLAQIAEKRGDYKKALELLKKAKETIPDTNLEYKRDLYYVIADTYFNLGDFKNAYLNNLIFIELQDSVQSAENASKIAQMTNVMNFENELALKKENNEKVLAIKQAEIEKEKLNRNIFLGALIFAVILGGITLVRFYEKKKLTDDLSETLQDLRETQDQLVQQEKLASLGQLTAGIAHEIKNPLNFVNNFSEVSVELIEEIREELNELKPNSAEALEILDDVEANLKKIHEHGSRADSIVKSMLQHSRGSSGKAEETDLNSLVKEYTNLSFHGMRASKNPINVDLHYELDDSIGKVPLIIEDFSRVIVNLANNAFDAMRIKMTDLSDLELKDYTPKLSVRTISSAKSIRIEIEDNGPGIPDELKDKVLQPFFTTKKGTEGTGLGLSITNDIVNAHGGVLNIESEKGKRTLFSITLNKR